MSHISCTFESYIEVEGDETEHLVEVQTTGNVTTHSGITDVSIDSIYSVDADKGISLKKVSVQDLARLMELAEEALLSESLDGAALGEDMSEDVAYENWVDNEYVYGLRNKGTDH